MSAAGILKYAALLPIPAGFARWSGGTQPAAGWVDYTLRMDPLTVFTMEADDLVWSQCGDGDDIVSFRSVVSQ